MMRVKLIQFVFLGLCAACRLETAAQTASSELFDGRTFQGWEGDLHCWRIEAKAIVGGSTKKALPENEFLCTRRSYTNFLLRFKFKLIGDRVNAGVQIRSQRVPNSSEMSGYQVDLVENGWGCLWDESRRNRYLACPNQEEAKKVVHRNDWNLCMVRCQGNRFRVWLNDYQTVDFVEEEANIPLHGFIGLQIHGRTPGEAWYKDIVIEELP